MRYSSTIALVIISMFNFSIYAQDVLYVPQNYTKIQEAIDHSSNGDTILVGPGRYLENINFNGKRIVLGSTYLTTLDETYIANTIIDGNQNGSVVTFENGEDSTTVLCGLTLTNGNGNLNEYSIRKGGGIFCLSSSPTLDHLIIRNNTVFEEAAGLKFEDSNSKLTDLIITENNAEETGGGLYINNSKLKIFGCVISNNSARLSSAILISRSECYFKNTLISNNTGQSIITTGMSDPIFEHVTIANNQTEGVVFSLGISNTHIINCIIWNNNETEISLRSGGQVTVQNSLIKDYQSTIDTVNKNDYVALNWLQGNINVDPNFSDTINSNYHLSNYSYCIGAGKKNNNVNCDLEENPRPNPIGSYPDLGCYEHQFSYPYAYFDSIICQFDTLVFSYKPANNDSIILNWSFENASYIDLDTVTSNYKASWNEIGYKNINLEIVENDKVVHNQLTKILVKKTPDSKFVTDKDEVCDKDTLTVNYLGKVSEDKIFSWNFDGAEEIQQNESEEYKVTWPSSGIKRISLQVTENGCESTISNEEVYVIQTPEIPLLTTENYQFGFCNYETPTIIKIVEPDTNVMYQWFFNDDSIPNENQSILEGFLEMGNYTITSSFKGCESVSESMQLYYEYPDKPKIIVEGPNVWYLGCSNDSAEVYMWYCDGVLIEGAVSHIIVAENDGDYNVLVGNKKNCFTSSDTIEIPYKINNISRNDELFGLKLFPNPCYSQFILEVTNKNICRDVYLYVYSVDGQLLMEDKISKTLHDIRMAINIEKLLPGAYYVIIKSSQFIFREKIIVLAK